MRRRRRGSGRATSSARHRCDARAGGSRRQGGPQQRGGNIRQHAFRGPNTLDPTGSASTFDNRNHAKYYNGLLWVPDDNPDFLGFECDLCERYELEDGGKTAVFYLHKGVTYDDGHELSSTDVKYTLNKIMGRVEGQAASPRNARLGRYVDDVDTRDFYTVAIRLFRPSPSLFGILSNNYAAILKDGTTRDDLGTEPDGTGPWKIKESVAGSHILMEPNPTYFKKDVPYLDTLTLQIVKDDAAAQAAFVTNKTDLFVLWHPYSPDTRKLVDGLVSEGKVVHHSATGESPLAGLLMNNQVPPLDNVKLRNAISAAVDRDGYAEVVYNGNGIDSPVVLFPAGDEFGRTLDEVRQLVGYRRPKDDDLAEAKRLLAEAGYPGGEGLPTFEILTEAITVYEAIAVYMQGQLDKIGIKTTVNPQAAASASPRTFAGDYEFYAGRKGVVTRDPDELLFHLHSDSATNNFGFANAEYDALFDQQSAELDVAKRKVIVRAMEDLFIRESPMVNTVDPPLDWAWWSFVKGFDPGNKTRAYIERRETLWRSE